MEGRKPIELGVGVLIHDALSIEASCYRVSDLSLTEARGGFLVY
jgi:hypothetical protein